MSSNGDIVGGYTILLPPERLASNGMEVGSRGTVVCFTETCLVCDSLHIIQPG